MADVAVLSLVPGLYGKLPGRGDFVGVGWGDATIEALDAWLSAGLAAWRPDDDAVFAAAFAQAPLYVFYMPAGWCGPLALHGVISPSVDRAGRYFFLVAGLAGAAAPAWHVAAHAPDFARAAEAAAYEALGPASDPDVLAAAIAAATPAGLEALPWQAGVATPAEALFWAEGLDGGEPIVVRKAVADAAALAGLLDGGDG